MSTVEPPFAAANASKQARRGLRTAAVTLVMIFGGAAWRRWRRGA